MKRTENSTWTTASGQRLTAADASALAEEFERDDSDTQFPRRAGRPSLTGRAAVSPQVTFRVTPELRQQAEHLAQQRGTTVSGWHEKPWKTSSGTAPDCAGRRLPPER